MTLRIPGSRFLIGAFVALALPCQALAQSDYSMSPIQFPSSFTVNAISQIGKVYDRPSALKPVPPATAKRVSAANLDFTPSAARRKANFAAFVEKSRAIDAVSAAQIEQMLLTQDLIGGFDRLMRRDYGMRANNVADAYTMWWTNAWQAANGDLSDLSPTTVLAVRAQAAELLGRMPAMRGASDAAKQEFAEAFLVQAQLIAASAASVEDDPAKLRELGAAVATGAMRMGLDLNSMTLTEEGFLRP